MIKIKKGDCVFPRISTHVWVTIHQSDKDIEFNNEEITNERYGNSSLLYRVYKYDEPYPMYMNSPVIELWWVDQ